MRNFILIALALLFLSAPVLAQDGAAPDTRRKMYNSESFTLDNGMRVVVIPNHRVPVVTHMVWYMAGAADEEPGKSGLAHYVEHMMFKGTETIPPGEFSKRIKALGGRDNAFTSQDFTAYFQSVTVDHLETVMQMEADRMQNLAFPPEEADSERLVVIEERRQRTENEPTGYFYEQMRTALFPNHPYGNPVVGWFHEMESLTRDNVMGFYKTWYAPNNAILIVSGDITAEELKPLAEKTYGKIPARDVPERHWTEVPPLLATPRLILEHEQIQQPSFVRLYRVPSLTEDKAESLALEMIAEIMSRGQNSRLYKSLVVEQKLATDVNMGYDSTARSDTILSISGAPAEGVSLEQLEAAFDEELAKLVKDGITQTELDEAVTRLQNAYEFALDSIMGPAMSFGQVLVTGGTIDDLEYWGSDIKALTVEQLNAAARKYLDKQHINKRPYVTGYILPKAQQIEEKTEGEAQ